MGIFISSQILLFMSNCKTFFVQTISVAGPLFPNRVQHTTDIIYGLVCRKNQTSKNQKCLTCSKNSNDGHFHNFPNNVEYLHTNFKHAHKHTAARQRHETSTTHELRAASVFPHTHMSLTILCCVRVIFRSSLSCSEGLGYVISLSA